MELSEAKEAFRNRVECEKIALGKLSKEKPKELLEYEKRKHILEIDETLLKALDNSVSKEYYEMTTKDLSNIINDLKARLDNSISKDEVRKKIEEIEHKPHWAECGDDYENEIKSLKELLGE